jgi:hypothetical protein
VNTAPYKIRLSEILISRDAVFVDDDGKLFHEIRAAYQRLRRRIRLGSIYLFCASDIQFIEVRPKVPAKLLTQFICGSDC